jgi:hypothetical protein
MRRRIGLALLMALTGSTLATGCDEGAPEPSEPVEPTIAYLGPSEHLVRASMSLRGTRPTLEELAAVEADPAALEGIVDGYLASPEFGRTMRDLHNEALLLRIDWAYYPAGFPNVGSLAGLDVVSINNSVMEAPLKLIEHVIMNDRPYTEIVTADYALTDATNAQVWGLDYQDGGAEWQVTKYTDGRGNAGILTDSWLYARWQSTPSNANRARANVLSRGLLCYDFLSRDVELDTSVNTADPNAVQNAVVENDACASCHQALDPLASFFKDVFPIVLPQDQTEYPMASMWFPGVFETYLDIEMREPSLFGKPGSSLEDLGRLISEDPRFSLCASQRFYAYLNHVDVEAVPFERAAELQQLFVGSGMNAKALAKAIVMSDDFRVSHAETKAGADEIVGYRHARPDELATMFQDLTGFVWATDLGPYTEGLYGVIELPRDSFVGWRVIGGGIDSAYVTRSGFTDNAATSLFLRGFAEEAASWVVDEDFAQADPAARKLLGGVEPSTADEASVRAQISSLHGRIFGELVTPDSEEVTASYELWQAALASSGDSERAWKTLLVAMLQDLRIAYY